MSNHNQTDRSLAAAKEKQVIKLGLDVHAKQITVCRQIDGSLPQPAQRLSWEALIEWVEKQVASGAEVWSCYEAGPCGYGLHRTLTALGVHNLVVAPQRWDEKRKRVKTDARDARELVDRLDRYLRGNHQVFSVVRVPTVEQEQRRCLVRQREAALKERTRCVLRAGGMMLTQGVHAPTGWWRPAAWAQFQRTLPAWLRAQVAPWQRQALVYADQVAAWEAKARQLSAGRALPKGLGTLTAALLESEILDWSRFQNRRQVGSYTGMCPSENSSDERRQQGAINKHGNPRVRHQLVEAVWRLEHWQTDYPPLRLLREAKGSRARKRAVVAVARRLAIDLWRLATGQTTAERLQLEMIIAPSAE